MSTWPKVRWPSANPTMVSGVSRRSTVMTSPMFSPSSFSGAETTISRGVRVGSPAGRSAGSAIAGSDSPSTASPAASVPGDRKESGSTPMSVRSTGVPSWFFALTMVRPIGVASATPSAAATSSTVPRSTMERVNAESVLVPSSNAMASASMALRPDTPSLTRPAVRPEMITMRMDIRASTRPISRNRVRAKSISRQARNMGPPGSAGCGWFGSAAARAVAPIALRRPPSIRFAEEEKDADATSSC